MWPCFPEPYVRVIQLHGFTGRAIKRKKTTFKQGTECPEFNETLTFDLYPNQLDTTTFLLLLCSRTVTEESIGQTGRKFKDRCLGKVALGSHVAGKGERDHWLAVIQNPRRVVSAWHTIKWRRRWVKSSWLSSRHARVVCQVMKNADLGRHDQSIDLLIFQRLWSTFNSAKYVRMGKNWLIPRKKHSPGVLQKSSVVYSEPE